MEKNYSVKWEDGRVVGIEIDGNFYSSADEISDPEDRRKIELLMEDWSELPDDFEVDMPAPGSDPISKFMFPLFLGVSLLMFAIAGIAAFGAIRTLSREASASGNVMDYEVRMDSEGNEYFYPVVSFQLADGSTETVQLSTGSWPRPYDIGEAVTVRYDPQQPRNARILAAGGTFNMFLVTLITGFLGLAFLGASFLVRWIVGVAPGEAELAKV